MIRRPPRSTRTDTLFPYTTLFRSIGRCLAIDPATEAFFQQARIGGFDRKRQIRIARTEVLSPEHPQRLHEQQHALIIGLLVVAKPGMRAPAEFDDVTCRHQFDRSEERRVGKEWVSTCGSGGAP